MSSQPEKIKVPTQAQIYQDSIELTQDSKGIIPFMESEVIRFEAESARYLSGEQDNTEFTPYRLRQGVYGQRQADVQMIRVKIPLRIQPLHPRTFLPIPWLIHKVW